ncbi:Sec1-like protein [Lichtheimia hyalospora FSU 10163]|nr:Sec1-like protein [Lichtheimia hyalospora FSU 10163]
MSTNNVTIRNGVDQILRTRFLDIIKSVQPSGRWKLVVVDSLSLKILNSACKMYDILEENVTVVENIEKSRQPYPSVEAVYILTPCEDSCRRLIDDLARPEGPMYAAAHIHFIQAMENDLFKDFVRRLRENNVMDSVKNLKDMYMDFVVREPAVFTLDDEQKFFSLFNNDGDSGAGSTILGDVDDMAKQLLCVCVALGENPLIRYHRPLDVPGTINRNIPLHLAKALQDQLDAFMEINGSFPPPKDPPMPRGTLIILDRTIDPVAPLLHEFTYQAMVADLLNVEEASSGIKYTYEYIQEDGTTKDQEAALNDQDAVYTSIRHMHIAITTEQLIDDFNKFMAENASGTGSGQASVKSLHDMKNMIANLPQYQEMKTKFSAHMTIASDCMAEFRDQNLDAIGLLEQNMACGETPEHQVPKQIVDELLPILDDPYTSQAIKTRLIMIWFATCDKVDPDELELLLAHARLDKKYKDAIDNLSLLGVHLSKSANKQGEKSSRWHRKKRESVVNEQQDVPFDLSRYVPIVKRVVEGHVKETIDQSLFPLLRIARPEDLRRDPTQSPKENYQLRVYKTQWHKKSVGKNAQPKPASGPPVIIFIAGGVTYSEMRSAYELSQTFDRDVYIGSTHIITPDRFVDDLSELDKPGHPPKEVVPPYTGSVHARSSPSSPMPKTKRK